MPRRGGLVLAKLLDQSKMAMDSSAASHVSLASRWRAVAGVLLACAFAASCGSQGSPPPGAKGSGQVRADGWQLYFGGGPAVNVYRFDLFPGANGDSHTELEGGFDTMVGFAHDSGLMLELRVGASGSPDLRFGVGYTFK